MYSLLNCFAVYIFVTLIHITFMYLETITLLKRDCKVPIVCAHKTWSINTYCNFLMAAILIRTLVCVPAAVWPEAAWPWVVLFVGLGVLTTLLGWNIGYFVPVFDGQHCADSCATQVSNREWFSLYLASHSYGSNNFSQRC